MADGSREDWIVPGPSTVGGVEGALEQGPADAPSAGCPGRGGQQREHPVAVADERLGEADHRAALARPRTSPTGSVPRKWRMRLAIRRSQASVRSGRSSPNRVAIAPWASPQTSTALGASDVGHRPQLHWPPIVPHGHRDLAPVLCSMGWWRCRSRRRCRPTGLVRARRRSGARPTRTAGRARSSSQGRSGRRRGR